MPVMPGGTRRLFEREKELAAIRGVLARAADGGGGLVLIDGPAGIGKTALLETARALATGDGFEVLTARGAELEHDFAFGLVRQLFEPVLVRLSRSERDEVLSGSAALAARALGLADADVGDASLAAGLHGLYWLVANLAERRSLLLVVDDAHWGDAPSLRWLCYLARRLEGMSLAVLVATRPGAGEPVAALLDELRREAITRAVEPAPLSVDGVRGLVEDVFGLSAAHEFVSACHLQSAGNPLLVRELATALTGDDELPDAAAAAQVRALPPQQALRAVLIRLGRLPAAASALARAVAVLEIDVQLRDAAVLAGLDEPAAERAADSLLTAGVLVADPLFRFVHPLLRAAVYEDIPAARRARDHARAAVMLRADPSGGDRVTAHLLVCPPTGEAWVIDHLRAAASAALGRGAAETAAVLLERCLAERPAPQARAQIVRELGNAKRQFAPREAIEHLFEAHQGASDPADRIAVARELAVALALSARLEDAYDLLERTLGEVDSGDRELALTVEAELLNVGLAGTGLATRVNERISRIPPLSGDTSGERLVLAGIARHHNLTAEPASQTADIVERALAGGQLLLDQAPDSGMYVVALLALMPAGRLETIREMVELATADARRRGSPLGLAQASTTGAFGLFFGGDLLAAEAAAQTGLELSRQTGFLPTIATSARVLIEVAVERGELDQADRLLHDTNLAGPLPDMFMFFNYLLYARGVLRLAQGRAAEGIVDLLDLGSRERSTDQFGPSPWRAVVAPALAADGDHDEAQRLVDDELTLARQRGSATQLTVALRAMAQLAGGTEAIGHLQEAAAISGGSPFRLYHAYALTDLGAALRRANQRAEAREHLGRGLDLAHRCGATVLAERARQELLATGARPRKLLLTGVESLTASERRVAELAAEGMTNKQIAQALFVTHKTVATHLAHTYSKLDIGSRGEIAAKLLGVTDPQR